MDAELNTEITNSFTALTHGINASSESMAVLPMLFQHFAGSVTKLMQYCDKLESEIAELKAKQNKEQDPASAE